jgi:hypothetical protein
MQAPLEASVDPALWGFMPSAAAIFRTGLVPVAPSVQTAGLPAQFPAAQVAAGLTVPKIWGKAGSDPLAPFMHRIQLGLGSSEQIPQPNMDGALQVHNDDPKTACYIADAPAAKIISGFVGGRTISLAGAKFTFGRLTRNFGVLTLCALDGHPLTSSERILLTLVTHTQNTGQTWNAAHTGLIEKGKNPPEVDAAEVDVSFAADGPRTVAALDSTGEKGTVVPSMYKAGQVFFSITPMDNSIWFAITSSNRPA